MGLALVIASIVLSATNVDRLNQLEDEFWIFANLADGGPPRDLASHSWPNELATK